MNVLLFVFQLGVICNFQICFSMNNYQTFGEENHLNSDETNLSGRLITNEYTIINEFSGAWAPPVNTHNSAKATNKGDGDYGNQHENQIVPDLESSYRKSTEAMPKAKDKSKFLNVFTCTCSKLHKEKTHDKCNICFAKYTNNLFKDNNKQNGGKKIILPCCRQHICSVCKAERIKEAEKNGLEVMLENKTPNDVVKCLKCPYCIALIPQNENQNGLLRKIKNDSIKLHEQMALMQQAEVDVLLAIMAQGKDPYRGNYGYWPILMKYISEHDQELLILIKNLEQDF